MDVSPNRDHQRNTGHLYPKIELATGQPVRAIAPLGSL
jgi:hypothetical protein